MSGDPFLRVQVRWNSTSRQWHSCDLPPDEVDRQNRAYGWTKYRTLPSSRLDGRDGGE